MAIWLELNIEEGQHHEETNTTEASVIVIAHYSTYSYNRNASGTMDINGVSYSFTASINGMEQKEGYETIYHQIIVVDRSVTDVVSCSVSVDAGGSSGTISASGSLTLTGGGSGGGSEPEEPDEPDEPTSPDYYWHVNYEIDERIKVGISPAYAARKNNPVTGVGSKTWYTDAHRYTYLWPYFADEDDVGKYDLIVSVVDANGDEIQPQVYSTGEVYYRIDGKQNTPAEYTVKAIILQNSTTRIDNGETFDDYQCYIDNGESWDEYIPHVDNGTGWGPCT